MEILGGAGAVGGFSVVAMMRESPEIVRRFVEYYTQLGASEIFVYFNGPAEELPWIAGVTRINCDPTFWDRNCDMPLVTIEDRMRICYRDCQARCSTEWLLIVDADEFLFSDRSIALLLDAIPDDIDSIGVPTAEAVWGPGDDLEQAYGSTHFRIKWASDTQWRLLRRMVYGAISSQMRWGVLGHVAGKHFVRAGRKFGEIGGHRSKRDGEVVTRPVAEVSDDWRGTYIGHFDAISLERWKRKWRWRLEKEIIAGAMSRARTEQMKMVGDAMAAGREKALFKRFYGLSGAQFKILSVLGYAFKRDDFFQRALIGEPSVGRPGGMVQTQANMR